MPRGGGAEVRLEERSLGRVVEPVVGRQIAEVEVAVVHPRILPVEDHQSLAGADEVRREQVVVTRHARLG